MEFNETDWLSNWIENNPEIFIPEEIDFKEDNDVSIDFYMNNVETEE